MLQTPTSTMPLSGLDSVTWEKRTAEVGSFRQEDVEFPTTWGQDAVNIVTQKYFRGTPGTPERETSLKQVIRRVVGRLVLWARSESGLSPAELGHLSLELETLLVEQRMAFNSPVWFNLGVEGTPQQGSACFILSIEDNMKSILNWYTEEGIIFQRGSGAGINLSTLRGSKEILAGGGTASGPVSFMRGADASAGTIKSGGKTRRAAKMVVLDVDHPDVLDFVRCKAREERKARTLSAAGFDVGVDGEDLHSLSYQNANNSVRLTDGFMRSYAEDSLFTLQPRRSDSYSMLRSRDIMREIAQAAWECGDPGVQFTDTINRWHTLPEHSPINASNPCSEYLSIDNSACNLASINLLKYLNDDGSFDIDGFRGAVRTSIIAMDGLAGRADYPTEKIGENARKYRQLGLGYTNLGALLMSMGVAYDSIDGRQIAASITSLMTAMAYVTSAHLAIEVGPFYDWEKHEAATLSVLHNHQSENMKLHSELRARNGDAHPTAQAIARESLDTWSTAISLATQYGVRNSQVTLLAPTGTISFMMGADTTGIEPDFALVKTKTLVGGGHIVSVNQSVPRALRSLGVTEPEILELTAGLASGDWKPEDFVHPVFATSIGSNALTPMAHIKMLAAVQPFLSGGISKTVNVPAEATVEDVEALIVEAWKLGVKSVAIYRDGCKAAQPYEAKATGDPTVLPKPESKPSLPHPSRVKMGRERAARTFSFRVADCKGYITAGEYEDGSLGEVFFRVAKQGSTLEGLLDSLAVSVSLGLQHGVPLEAFCKLLIGTKFEPHGLTGDELRTATSIVDYIFRQLALTYLDASALDRLGLVHTNHGYISVPHPLSDQDLDQLKEAFTTEAHRIEPVILNGGLVTSGSLCASCGSSMQRTGTCFSCPSCGSTGGCG